MFYPTQIENQAPTQIVKTLGEEIAKISIKELEDPKKTTLYHLSNFVEKWTWSQATENDKKAGLGKQATNDFAESPFAGMKEEY